MAGARLPVPQWRGDLLSTRARTSSILLLLVGLLLLLGSGVSPIGGARANTGCPGSTNAFGTQSLTGDCAITANTVWGNGTLTLAGSLNVNGGVTLTLWNLVVKFSQTSDLQHVLSVGGTILVRGGGLQSNDAYHWHLSASGRVDLERTNVSNAGSGSTAGLDILGASNNVVSHSRITGTRVRMLSNHNDYFGYNNLSNYDDSANGNQHILWVGSNATVEHNSFWNVTEGTQSVILTYLNWGNTRFFANDIKYRANGNNAMGIEVINIDHTQTTVKPTGYTVTETWNNLTVYYRSGGSNDVPFDNEYSERLYIANNTVSGQTDGCLQGGGLVNSLMENNKCHGDGIGGSFGIYDYIYDNTFNVFRNNKFDNYASGLEFQTGNATVVGNTWTNLTGSTVFECSSAPCAGSSTATTNNLYAGNSFSWKPGYGPVGNMSRFFTTNYLANVFVGHTPASNAPTRYYVSDLGTYKSFNGDWLYWGNAAFRSLTWSNNTNGSRCLTATLPSLTAVDCKPLGTALSTSLSVAGPIDQHGSVDLANNPRQATVLYRLGRDKSTLSLKTANPGSFTFSVTGEYYGTYRVNVYNYSGSRWENFTKLYTTPSGSGSYARSMSGFYNVSFVLVNLTSGGPPPPSAPPSVTTNAANSITQTGATLNGQLTSLGTAASVGVGFLWGTSPSLSGAANVTSPQSPLASPASFTYSLTGLSPGTQYYVQAWANGEGFAVGSILGFTTGVTTTPPAVSTRAASFVGQTSATFNGNLTNLGSASSVAVGFLYGTDPGLSGATNVTAGTRGAPAGFSTAVASLSSGVTYYAEAWANGAGFATGSIVSFTTLPTPPTVATFAATSIGQTTATLNGNLGSLGSASPVTVGFQYGPNATLSGATNVTAGTVGSPGAFSAALHGLSSGTTYYFLAWAHGAGFAGGNILSFSATNPGSNAPRAITEAGSGVSANLATINGNLASLGSASAVNVGFLYGTSPTLAGALNVTVGIAQAPQDFNLSLTGLGPGQTYYFEAWAAGQGFSLGGIRNVTTDSLAPPVGPSVLGVTYNPDLQQLDVVFSQPMDPASVAAALSIQPSTEFVITWVNATHLQVQLASSPSGSTVYNLTIGSTARNSGGLVMGDPFTFRFTVTPAAPPGSPVAGFFSNALPWITVAVAGAAVVVFVLYRRSRKKVLALRQTARVLAQRIQQLRATYPNPAPAGSRQGSVRPTRVVKGPVPKARSP
ncbi:MAG TPA: Ig-like domain-containing protein [Thermoplasmata archaeon]|nr:Ig-like domain-containing protein [Thermoplasmata archaeon]